MFVSSDLVILLVLSISKLRSRRKVPKEKPNRRKPKKPIPKRGPVRARDNPFKQHLRKPMKVSQAECIYAYRMEQLKQTSPAIEALETALRGLGIRYRREEPVIVDYKRFFLIDVWCPDIRVGWEADGFAHKAQKVYDRDRDAIIEKLMGGRILRFFNGWYLKPDLKSRILIELGRPRQ